MEERLTMPEETVTPQETEQPSSQPSRRGRSQLPRWRQKKRGRRKLLNCRSALLKQKPKRRITVSGGCAPSPTTKTTASE